MGVMDYFKPVSTWSTEEVRAFISEREDGSYNLVDVRQPGEYEKGHLPGAVLIPVGELDRRTSELDPGKPTILYCGAGVRSRAAVSILQRAGFDQVYSMSGGMNAWSGVVAEGFPEAGVLWFSAAQTPEELTALAWVLEDGTEAFYKDMAQRSGDTGAAALFSELVQREEEHKEMLAKELRRISKIGEGSDIPSLLGGHPQGGFMEGGMRVDEAVVWAQGKGTREILEMCIAQEAVSYDRYQTLKRRENRDESAALFNALAVEEKRHLSMLTELFEKQL